MKDESKENTLNFRKYCIILIIIFFAIRIPLMFIAPIYDLLPVYRAMVEGSMPYCDHQELPFPYEEDTHSFPPLFYIILLVQYLIFGDITAIMNPIYLICQFFNLVLVMKLVVNFYDENAALIAGTLIVFFPYSILSLTFDMPSIVAITFMLGSFYFFIRDSIIPSAIFLALGTAVVYLPAIIILPLSIYYTKNKQKLSFILYLIIFIGTLVLISLPFLISCPSKFIYFISQGLSAPHSSNISYIILGNYLYTPIFEFFNFRIIIFNLIQIVVISLTFIYFYKKPKLMTKKRVLFMSAIFLYIIPVITLYLHPRFFYFPFMIVLLLIPYQRESNSLLFSNYRKYLIIFAIIFISFSFIALYLPFQLKMVADPHMVLINVLMLLFGLLWLAMAYTLFYRNQYIKKLISYNFLGVIGFILYKFFYSFFSLHSINLVLSYLLLTYIGILCYFYNFYYMKKYL